MQIDRNSLIGQKIIALQLAEKTRVLQALAAFGSGLLGDDFGQALIKEGIITIRQLEKVSQALRAVPWDENQALWLYLQSHTNSHLDFATLEQVHQFARKNQLSLGQALVKTRTISAQDFLSLRERIRSKALVCPKCNQKYLPLNSQECCLCPCGEILIGPAPPSQTQGPHQFGEYEILSEIARGGMGVVFRARHPSYKQEVALKLLIQQECLSKTALKRFEKEAKTAKMLDHPNIIKIYDYGEFRGVPFMAMEYIRGKTLRDLLGSTPVVQGLAIVHTIVLAMDYAHQQKIIHRDLKTANIIIDRSGKPLIADFGLAKDMESDTMLTQSGIKIGTPAYMAPEQASGQSKYSNHLTDIYQLGVLIFQVFTKQLPYTAKTPAELFYKIIHLDPPDPAEINPDLPPALSQICQKAMAKNPKKRYQSARDMARDIQSLIQGKPLAPILSPKKSLRKTGVLKQADSSLLRKRRLSQYQQPSSNLQLYWILAVVALIVLVLLALWLVQ